MIQNATDVGRTSEKCENPKYAGPMSGGQASRHGGGIQEASLGGGEGARPGAQWPILEEVEYGDRRAVGALRTDARPWAGAAGVGAGGAVDGGDDTCDQQRAPVIGVLKEHDGTGKMMAAAGAAGE